MVKFKNDHVWPWSTLPRHGWRWSTMLTMLTMVDHGQATMVDHGQPWLTMIWPWLIMVWPWLTMLLWFIFRLGIATLLKAVHGTGDVTKQIIRFQHVRSKLASMDPQDIPKSMVGTFLMKSIRKTKAWTNTKACNNCNIAGKEKLIDDDVDAEMVCQCYSIQRNTAAWRSAFAMLFCVRMD